MQKRRAAGWGILAVVVVCWSSACGSPTRNLGGIASAGMAGEDDSGAAAGSRSNGAAGHAGDSTTGSSGAPTTEGSAGDNSTGGDEPVSGSGGTTTTGAGGAAETGGGTAAGAGGAAGKGGSGGSAGAPPAPVGSKCTLNAQCALGFCVDGVCCENACTGNCKACSAAGQCNLTPTDDAGCGTITCPTSTSCRTYQGPITTNRCASFGVCKTVTACTSTTKAARTPCPVTTGGPELCDASGTCVSPTISCGGVNCPLNTNVCCAGGDTFTCLARAGGNECQAQNKGGLIACDEPGDCPINTQCCITDSPAGNFYSCSTGASCPASGGVAHFYPICKSPAIPTALACPAQTSCSIYTGPTTFEVCH